MRGTGHCQALPPFLGRGVLLSPEGAQLCTWAPPAPLRRQDSTGHEPPCSSPGPQDFGPAGRLVGTVSLQDEDSGREGWSGRETEPGRPHLKEGQRDRDTHRGKGGTEIRKRHRGPAGWEEGSTAGARCRQRDSGTAGGCGGCRARPGWAGQAVAVLRGRAGTYGDVRAASGPHHQKSCSQATCGPGGGRGGPGGRAAQGLGACVHLQPPGCHPSGRPGGVLIQGSARWPGQGRRHPRDRGDRGQSKGHPGPPTFPATVSWEPGGFSGGPPRSP